MQKPTPDQVNAAIARLVKPGASAYFFDKLNNPFWIEPLAERGFFKRPPAEQRHETEGTVSFPDWPELRFLERMAPLAPEVVGKVAVAIPETSNARVRQTLVKLGSQLTRDFSRKLARRVFEWVEKDYFLRAHFGEPVPRFISHLAEEGELDLALSIARQMFRVDQHENGRSGSVIDSWHMERYLAACLPTLRETAGVRTLDLLRALLLEATESASRNEVDDYSYIWRASILKANFSVKQGSDVLIDALRDSALELARKPEVGVERVCRLLLKPGRPLLKRIALYVASQAASANEPIVMELLSDLTLVDRLTCREEYGMLLQAAFPQLSQENRASIESLLQSDPLHSIPADVREQTDAAQLDRIRKRVLRDRIVAFGSALPDTLHAMRDGLLAELGEPPERRAAVAAWVGPTSPLAVEDLLSRTVEQIIAFAHTFIPSNEFGAPQPEGLGRAIGDIIEGRLKEFADQADKWIGQDPTYVRAVITAFGDALQRKASIEDWSPTLKLIHWAVAQKDSQPASADDPWAGRDMTWRWTRQSVARLIERALQQNGTWPNFQHRAEVWDVLEKLMHDEDPDAAEDRSSDQDALTTAINSTRGVATHALMGYVWWVHENTNRAAPFTFDVVPEARGALERALTDPHPAILSVFGERFRQLYFLDAQWTREHIEAIFPAESEREKFWKASWNTFVEYSPPYDPAFDPLRPKYECAVARLHAESAASSKATGERGLGQHLASYFWRDVGGEFTRNLLLRYFDSCSPAAAGNTIFFFGQGLTGEKVVPANTVSSLIGLWDELSQRGGQWAEQKRREVARQFAHWFVSSQLPADWRLQRLESVLASGAGIVDSESLLAGLASLISTHPQPVARCVKLLLLDGEQTWFLGERESAGILEALIASQDDISRTLALETINGLVERGNLAARDILARASSSKRDKS